MVSLSDLITSIGTAGTWFWSLFADFIDMIASNSLLLYPVILMIVAGTVGLVIKLIRQFGLKGNR